MSGSARRSVRTAYLVASVAGVAFFAMSVGLLGVWPARVLRDQTRAMAPEHPPEPTRSEQRGRAIYAREGCAYCHTQQIRYLHADMTRFGAPTLAWETRRDSPHLWGTRRIGPDLSRAGGTRSADWQLLHLFAPRLVVPGSVMPAYPGLFDGGADRPTQEARDLVAYLESLGRAREWAGSEGADRARAGCDCPDDQMAQMAFAAELNTHPARARRDGTGVPALSSDGDLSRGQPLFGRHCATCHGAAGTGDGPAAAFLSPRPTNLTEHAYSTERLAEVLWNGVAGTAMPAWRDRSIEELAALARAVQALSAPRAQAELPAHLLPLGQQVYAANCVQCHGERGDGRGTAAGALPMAPADFVRQQPTLALALRAVREGVHGTPMAPWTSRLSDAEVVAVAHYVRSLFGAGGSRP